MNDCSIKLLSDKNTQSIACCWHSLVLNGSFLSNFTYLENLFRYWGGRFNDQEIILAFTSMIIILVSILQEVDEIILVCDTILINTSSENDLGKYIPTCLLV